MMIAVSKVSRVLAPLYAHLVSYLHSLLILIEKEGAREYLIRPSNGIAGVVSILCYVFLFYRRDLPHIGKLIDVINILRICRPGVHKLL